MSPPATQAGAAAFRTDSFEHRGHRLVYDVYGADEGGGLADGGRVIVYLHGLLLDSELNRGIAQALADSGSSVVLLDLLGHGRSDRPRHASEYRIDSYADRGCRCPGESVAGVPILRSRVASRRRVRGLRP